MTDLSPVVGEAQASPVERFRKKPLEVAAIRYTGSNPEAVARFAGEGYTFGSLTGALVLHAPAAEIYVHDGDWVVRTDHGIRAYAADVFAEQFDPAPEPLELTPPEQAAVAKSPHMSTCHEPVCVDCAKELRQLRRYIVAIWPVIEEEATRPLKERLEAAEDEYRLLADQIGHLASDGWDDDAAEVDILIRFVTHLATFHPDCPGRFCDDAPSVAAALDPTPIPDGEREVQ